MVRTYGQMPLVLFTSPHLSHLIVKKKSNQASISTGISLSKSDVKNNTKVLNYVFNSVKGLKWGLFFGSPEIDSKYLKMPSFTFQVNRLEKYLINIYTFF